MLEESLGAQRSSFYAIVQRNVPASSSSSADRRRRVLLNAAIQTVIADLGRRFAVTTVQLL